MPTMRPSLVASLFYEGENGADFINSAPENSLDICDPIALKKVAKSDV